MIDAVDIPFDLNSDSFRDVVEKGRIIKISPAAVLSDLSIVLRVIGPSDRITVVLSDLKVSKSTPVSYPVTINWGVGIGSQCVRDENALVTGVAPDPMVINSASDRRIGVLYSVANVLTGQWVIYAGVDPGVTTEFTARLSIVVDHKGGGGEISVYKGGVFD